LAAGLARRKCDDEAVVKVLFAGPSLFGAAPDLADIERRGPAAQGDIARAVADGADVIGLVDGAFGEVAAVWHKEILLALSRGVRVFGAASMGALRAAECAPFGMVPIGEIAQRFADGGLDDDAAVAVVHAPAEFGHEPLSEALVDALATISGLAADGLVTGPEAEALAMAARTMFFGIRTPDSIVAEAMLPFDRRAAVLAAYLGNRVSVKRRDALLLVEHLRHCPATVSAIPDWRPAASPSWQKLMRDFR
jgi:hypothetical protein